MTDNFIEANNESSSPSSNSSSCSLTPENLAVSLVSPNTEKAVEELINSNPPRSTITSRASPQQIATTATGSSSSSDDFENLQKAVQILGKAKQLDEIKKYDEALKLYRQGVDMLLEELITRRDGTDSSRSYLRDKCNDFMNRIDQV